MTTPGNAALRSACAAQEIPSLDPTGQRDWLRLVGGLRERRSFFWLDSASQTARNGRFSFAGAEPFAEARVRGARIERQIHRDPGFGADSDATAFGDALDAARTLMPPPLFGGAPVPVPFVGGVVGYLGYEAGDAWETLPETGVGLPELPDAAWLGVDRVYAIDHLEGRLWAVSLGVGSDERAAEAAAKRGLREMVDSIPAGSPPPGWPGSAVSEAECVRGFDAETHGKAVDQVRERIAAGDVYQACLTHQFELPFTADPWALYGALRAHNPAPFAAYLELSDVTWVGSSPERFLSATPQGWLESRPIKGTRPRGTDAEEDRQLRAALEASAKDRAENLMIVDLVRNDLGRVAELGSVHVPELFHIEPHPSVFQMVSTVRARLASGVDVFDAVRAAFPPGSMTGAPKLAAMEILRGLEPDRRGAYAGALGYFDARGGADLSVVIRTAFVRGDRAWLHSGGGIVYDSDPTEEWEEAETKARAVLEAIAAVESEGAR
jgi:para-aminobenzoate synthetase component 1